MNSQPVSEKLRFLGRSLLPWVAPLCAVCGSAAIVAGVFEPDAPSAVKGLVVAGILLCAILWDAIQRLGFQKHNRAFFEIEGPLLWVVLLWAAVRAAGPQYGPHLTPFCAVLLGTVCALFQKPLIYLVIAVAAVLELSLAAIGRQSVQICAIHLAIYGAASAAQSIWRWWSDRRAFALAEKAEREKNLAVEDAAWDFGLKTSQMPALSDRPSLSSLNRLTCGMMTVDYISESFALQLQLVREALGLCSAVVLWRDAEGEKLNLRGFASERELCGGPYPLDRGVPATVMNGHREVAMAPVPRRFAGLPYYENCDHVGALLAVAIPEPSLTPLEEPRVAGVLCVDRVSPSAWTEQERRVLHLTAEKLCYDVEASQHWKQSDRDRIVSERFAAVLQELNATLDLESAADVALKAVKTLAHADMAVLSLCEQNHHRVLRAVGLYEDRFQDLEFEGDEGLVGQAVALGQILPAADDYRGVQAIFSSEDRLPELRSLLIVPLKKAQGGVFGALTVASQTPGVCAKHQEILTLIADQVAVKIDLARAHEQIRLLATTDGLTGLANHRVFQQTFDQMLARAERRSDAQGRLAFILCDIDFFKKLNDNYGHPFGDLVLKGVSRTLAQAVRKVDLAARYGGEEFALLLEGSDRQGAMAMAERIRSSVEALNFEHETGIVKATLSLGVAAFPEDGLTKVELIEHGDQALYCAKHEGRNRVKSWAEVQETIPTEDQKAL